MKTTIISGADASFIDLLLQLVQSIRACGESRDVDLCILDVGLTPQQVSQLTPLVTRIVPAEWNLDFPARHRPDMCPSWYKAMYCRPFFPEYFPDYELMVWIDADAWLCNWEAMKLLLRGGQMNGFAIVPEVDRAYPHCFVPRQSVLTNLKNTYYAGFGPDAARFASMPVLNCGVFAMRRDVPYWGIWAEILARALQQGVGPLIEQCALNVAVYNNQIPACFLPSWCNWNCAHSVPILDPQTRNLLVPLLPFEPISICHLVDCKRQSLNVTCSDGTFRHMPLTYEAVRLLELPSPANP